jgi:acyl-coenzyme A synthetase/AMP-(fatty) acid ligase
VLARTKARCLGYVGEPDRFVAKDRGGWFNTGDLGSRGRDGRVRLIDREVDLMPGDSCIELEDVIDDRLAEVVECVILAVPGAPAGSAGPAPAGSAGPAPAPAVPVVVTTDGRLDKAAWRAAVADLPPLADPVVLDWAELPRTGTGKVRRAELRARLLGSTDTAGTGRWT